MINRVIITGRLTADPQLRVTANGIKTTKFNVAIDRHGEGADFPLCVAWDKTAENICTYCHKGSQVGIEGRIQTSSYDDKETGKKIFTTTIWVYYCEFLDGKPLNSTPQATENALPTLEVTAEELPF